jgi:hypothetical protein
MDERGKVKRSLRNQYRDLSRFWEVERENSGGTVPVELIILQ